MNVGSLFSGIGGFDLGLERAGMRTTWFVEQDEFCQRVINEHWPNRPIFPDIREVCGQSVWPERRYYLEPVDVLCGGFPCQDISLAGAGAGITGTRSGLWSEYARLIGELEPRWVIVENVSALIARGLSVVLADLAALGYDAEWDCLPASAFGAPHQRDRVWLVAYPQGDIRRSGLRNGHPRSNGRCELADSGESRETGNVANADQQRRAQGLCVGAGTGERPGPRDAVGGGQQPDGGWWATEPDVGRVAYGVPARVDRCRALGNALVPQIAEWIGRRIIAYEEGQLDAVA